MPGYVQQSGAPINKTSSGVVSLASGALLVFYVNSTTGGTIVLRSGTLSGSTAVSGTITPAIGWHEFPAAFPDGCYATIANTLDVTFAFAAG